MALQTWASHAILRPRSLGRPGIRRGLCARLDLHRFASVHEVTSPQAKFDGLRLAGAAAA